ncbi:MAG TPA: GyrI-like domain-containing protein [Steroidobacteraceae bacterium]|nr:GyrI-like domain-containing protein [Steroidobacteraceae bacterium]
MKIAIAERQPVKVAYLRYTGPLGEPLGKFWRGTVAPWLAEHGLIDCPRYGVAIDNPMTTPPEKCRYDACVELPAGLTLPDAAEKTIAGGRYAVTHFKGTGAQIGEAWGMFVRTVLADPANRLDADRHGYEHYPRGANFDTRTGEFGCELCLPLAR